MKKIILLTISLLIYGCSSGGGGDDTANTLQVNLIGTWNYDIATQNTVCDGLIAKGILTVSSLNGDLSKIGDVSIQGEGFDLDSFSNCVFTVVDEVDTDSRGDPAVQTANEYLASIKEDNLGDNTIKSVRLDSFTNNKIIEVEELTNGVIFTFIITR